jgi:hypothetical protein
LEVQAKAFVQRKTSFYKRNVITTIFEVMVPVLLLTIGLCFTKLEFDLTIMSRRVMPELFPKKQRILFNQLLPSRKGNYTWKGSDYVEAEPTCGGADEEFDDESTCELPLIQDVAPMEIMDNFPKKTGENTRAFNYEIMNVEGLVLLERNSV